MRRLACHPSGGPDIYIYQHIGENHICLGILMARIDSFYGVFANFENIEPTETFLIDISVHVFIFEWS